MSTKLAAAIAQPPQPQASVASRFMAALNGRRPMKDIVIPGLELPAVMTLVGSERLLDIEGESLRAMAFRGIERNVLNEARYELDLALRVLAESIVETRESLVPVGTLAEWGLLPPETVAALWIDYSALREEHDPIDVSLTAEDIAEISDAIAKKNSMLLRYFGPRKLASYMISTAAPPATSAEPKSSDGDSSPAS